MSLTAEDLAELLQTTVVKPVTGALDAVNKTTTDNAGQISRYMNYVRQNITNNKKSRTGIIIGGGVMLALVLGGLTLYYVRRKQKEEKRKRVAALLAYRKRHGIPQQEQNTDYHYDSYQHANTQTIQPKGSYEGVYNEITYSTL